MLDLTKPIVDWMPKNKTWSSDVQVHEKCILNNGTVYMDSLVHDKVRMLTGQISTEWLGYLIGKVDGTKAYIEDIFIPEQSVSSTHVHVKDQVLPENIIGTVHSHHTMGNFLSGTDHRHLVGNHAVTIVASRTGLMSKMRVKAPCEALMLLDADIEVEDSAMLKEFFEQNITKIEGSGVNPNTPKLNWAGKIWRYPATVLSNWQSRSGKNGIVVVVIVVLLALALILYGRGF